MYRCGETPAGGHFPRARESGNASQENKVPAYKDTVEQDVFFTVGTRINISRNCWTVKGATRHGQSGSRTGSYITG
jgi:hypothetical protein